MFAADWPGNFFGGQGTARLYLDDQASPDQRRELEAVFSGQKGGLLEGLMGAVITQWLPAQTARIVVQRGATLSITVGTVGQATLAPLVDPAGRPTTVQGTAAQAAFQSASMQLASSQGTRWSTRTCGRGRGTLARCIRFSGPHSHKERAAETFRPERLTRQHTGLSTSILLSAHCPSPML